MPGGEVLQAHIRAPVPSFLVAHVSGLSPCVSKARLARIDPVRASDRHPFGQCGSAREAAKLVGRRRQTAESSKSIHRLGRNQTVERSLQRISMRLQLSTWWTWL